MRRLLLLLCASVLVAATAPALAVIGGEPDGNRHPYVGLVHNGEFVCSAFAISPKLVVTAAHCFGSAGEEVAITFDPDALAAGSRFHGGRWYPHPGFCAACGGGLPGFATNDVAVIVLDRRVALARYARLPSVGLVDTLEMGAAIDIVGYGIQDQLRELDPDEAFTRHFVAMQLVASEHTIADEFVKLSAAKGGTCFGDSGGPDLVGGTDTAIAVNSFGTNPNCAGVSYSNRLDTRAALEFIESFSR